MGLTEENVLKIVGMHLNKTNRTPRSVTQLESLSKGLGNTLRVTGAPKQRQVRFVKTQIVDFVNEFLKKKKRHKFIEADLGNISIGNMVNYGLPFLEIRYYMDDFFKETREFWDYYQYYYLGGQHRKEDFMLSSITFEDPEGLRYYEGYTSPIIYIKYEHMRSILDRTRFPPTSRTALKKLMKQVYTRSRTRGFFKPSEVDKYADLIVDFYVKNKSAKALGLGS
jgi:hypothetical protein